MKKIQIGSDFSGVGAFNQALMRLGIPFDEVFACDLDDHARETFILNYGEPPHYPRDVYEREIPKDPLTIYMSSPPCQAFSLAGKRGGESDKRGVLFYNTHEFIQVNKPRFFIIENVKGLLSDDGGETFRKWLTLLSGKSLNGTPQMFPFWDAVPYHVYWTTLKAQDFGVPQSRERVFIVGIRDDVDNRFSFPKPQKLTMRLKDILQDNPDSKYNLTEKMKSYLINRSANFNKGKINLKTGDSIASIITSSCHSLDITDNIIVTDVPSKYYLSEKAIEYMKKDSDKWKNRQGYMNHVDNELSTCITANFHKGVPYNVMDLGAKVRQINEAKQSNSNTQPFQQNRVYHIDGISPAIVSGLGKDRMHNINTEQWRRLTPRECFRLMDFPDSFQWTCSDTQAYRQAGNSIVVSVLSAIIKQLPI